MIHVSLRRRIYVFFVVSFFRVYFKLYHRMTIEGTENIPLNGPLFIIINHVSYLEPFALGVGLNSRGLVPGAHIYTVAKKELYAHKLVGLFLDSIGMFPIDRERTDMGAMRTMLTVLKEKKMIAMAPEGTRSPTGQLQEFQPVVAKIAISRHIPILPSAAFGVEKAMPVGSKFPLPFQITLKFGPVFELSEFYGVTMTGETDLQAAKVMRAHVAELLPEWMREIPPASHRVGAVKH